MSGFYTHIIRIPGVAGELSFVAETDQEAQQLACDALGLNFLPPGTLVTHLTEAPACSSGT